MKVRFVTLFFNMLDFGSNLVERDRSTVAMGIQPSDFVHQITIKAFPDDLLRRTKYKFKGPGKIFLATIGTKPSPG